MIFSGRWDTVHNIGLQLGAQWASNALARVTIVVSVGNLGLRP
jgi:hypothetical protein